jgi:hypothetical protein
MHKRYLFLIALLWSFSLSSCEEIVDADGLPYEEKLVIHSILFADSTGNTVQISRTLPVNVPFDTNQAYLKDAVGSITDGETTYPLEYIGYGGRYRAKGLMAKAGKHYSLSVSWRDMSITASTEILAGGSIDSAWTTDDPTDYGYVERNIRMIVRLPNGASAITGYYGVFIDPIYGGWTVQSNDYRLISKRDEKDDGRIYTAQWLQRERTEFDTLTAKLHVFAPGYYEYSESRNRQNDEMPGNPTVIKWNVEGDGIGIFFGCNILYKRVQL